MIQNFFLIVGLLVITFFITWLISELKIREDKRNIIAAHQSEDFKIFLDNLIKAEERLIAEIKNKREDSKEWRQ